MARAVATNFYTPKELTFQGGLMWARASRPRRKAKLLEYCPELSQIPARAGRSRPHSPTGIHEGTLPFVKLSGWFRFPVTICPCAAESSWRWSWSCCQWG
jgi:hypothetical protein